MHQYWYLNAEGNGEQYNNQISMSSLYSQPQITKAEEMNGLKIPENWSCRVYPFGWDSSANYTGFNHEPPPFSWGQPIHYAGMMPQGHPANWTPLPGHAGFNFQKPPFPWAQPFNHTGMFAQGHLAALLSPPAKPFHFNTNNNWGILGNSPGWGGQISPMGWGNNGGNGQPGMLGNLLTVGKGTMNGIGMLSSLIGMGKFFF
ncbi:hypothetical protein CN327_29615 [Bacillus cereus]|uniref:hypothetical protein n=1 Tax=Bacillus nitratireducens TaxID=2026193 RepID=UPI000BED6E9A|nr:hypothetical protein [Bacillus nitratireducens]PEE15502.1 hypothetical protein CON53_24205 [Bacillus cereus]MED0903070.1 hypothetical protein [Bacillus nitratireducens]PES72936.1 hypothetical protein CN509_27195 [Bacillus cereus]PES94681.1 hypothetical protein CN505_30675 [Bacillus cereus]PFF27296.1 hypothetical protein CN327_29615 [Bacillus cereus]